MNDYLQNNTNNKTSGKYEKCGILGRINNGAEVLKDCEERINELLNDNTSNRGLKQEEIQMETRIMKEEMIDTTDNAKELLNVVKKLRENQKERENVNKQLQKILEDAKNIDGMEDILEGFTIF